MEFISKKVIIFDFDGTLIDSAPDLAMAVNHTLSIFNKKPFSDDNIRLWIGNGIETLLKRALSGKKEVDPDIDSALIKKSLDIFSTYYSQRICVKTSIFPNVTETLRTLKSRGYKLAIVTNKPYEHISPILNGLQLANFFEIYLGADSLPQKKPHPLPLLHICKELGVSIEQSIMIGDSKNDIIAAKAAKMDSIGVTYGYNYGEDIELYKPDFVCDDLSIILSVLK